MRHLTINRIATSQLDAIACSRLRGHSEPVREAGVLRTAVLRTAVLTADVLMPVVRQTCVGARAIANAYWLHTPKFGTFDHFQRWRFAT